jgi:hypothetical protein
LYIKTFTNLLRNDETVLFFDESHFYTHHSRLKKWTTKYKENVVPLSGNTKSLELLFICDNKGFFRYMTNTGRSSERKLMNFFQYIIDEICYEDYLWEAKENKKLRVYLDNHGIHHSTKLKNMLLINGINILYPPVYRPEYNLAEFIFSVLKRQFYENMFINMYVIFILNLFFI